MKKGFRLIVLISVCIIFVSVLNAAASSDTVYGVLDRYTDNGLAVILLEDRKEEWMVQKDELPASSREGVWFLIRKNVGMYSILSIDWEKTKKAAEQSQKLMEKLRSK
ncbi:MAG TPA: DUF3006 domain-containing protein [Bacillota bacterium]|nr:DUF3006 domain-containing protein [Bacillota bacterium]